MAFSFVLTDHRVDEYDLVWHKLFKYNMQFTEEDQHTLLGVFVRNEIGELVGGLLGETFWRWLHINILWIDEHHRRSGLGTQLMCQAEAEAVRRGCRHAYLDTFNFQAPDFYRKLGYSEWGVLDDFPPRHQRVFFKKDLPAPTT